MREIIVVLSVIIAVSAAVAGYLKIPEGLVGRVFAALICLGLAFEICRIGVTYFQDEQKAGNAVTKEKADKKFQDSSLKAHEETIGSTTRIESKLDKALTPSLEKKLAARYPLGHIFFETDGSKSYKPMPTDKFDLGAKVKLDTEWTAATLQVENNLADIHFKNVTFTILREHDKTTETVGNEVLVTIPLEEGEQREFYSRQGIQCILEVIDPTPSAPSFVVGFRKAIEQGPLVVAGSLPGVFSSKILQKDDPNLTPEQKKMFEGMDGVSDEIKNGPWVETQFHGGMSAPDDNDERNVLMRFNIQLPTPRNEPPPQAKPEGK